MVAFIVGALLGFVIGIFTMIIIAIICVHRGDELEDGFYNPEYKEDWK